MGVAACGSTALDAFSVSEPAVARVAALSSVITRTLVNFEVILSIVFLSFSFVMTSVVSLKLRRETLIALVSRSSCSW
jgi:hypothetical protein